MASTSRIAARTSPRRTLGPLCWARPNSPATHGGGPAPQGPPRWCPQFIGPFIGPLIPLLLSLGPPQLLPFMALFRDLPAPVPRRARLVLLVLLRNDSSRTYLDRLTIYRYLSAAQEFWTRDRVWRAVTLIRTGRPSVTWHGSGPVRPRRTQHRPARA